MSDLLSLLRSGWVTRQECTGPRSSKGTLDLQPPCGYQHRWIVERTIGWLGNFRRLVVHYDRSLRIYRAFFDIACFMIVLRKVVQ